MGLPEQTRLCTPTTQKTLINHGTQLKILSKGGEGVYRHPTVTRIGISFPFDQRTSTLYSYHFLNMNQRSSSFQQFEPDHRF